MSPIQTQQMFVKSTAEAATLLLLAVTAVGSGAAAPPSPPPPRPPAAPNSPPKDRQEVAIIAGFSVGAGVFIIVLIAVGIVSCCRAEQRAQRRRTSGTALLTAAGANVKGVSSPASGAAADGVILEVAGGAGGHDGLQTTQKLQPQPPATRGSNIMAFFFRAIGSGRLGRYSTQEKNRAETPGIIA